MNTTDSIVFFQKNLLYLCRSNIFNVNSFGHYNRIVNVWYCESYYVYNVYLWNTSRQQFQSFKYSSYLFEWGNIE